MNDLLPSDDGNVTEEVSQETPSQAQPIAETPALTSEQEALVNRLVEEQVSQRLANVDSLVERGVQSALTKRKNKAEKEIAETKRTISNLAESEEWDADAIKEKQARAEKNIRARYGLLDTEDEPVSPPSNHPK